MPGLGDHSSYVAWWDNDEDCRGGKLVVQLRLVAVLRECQRCIQLAVSSHFLERGVGCSLDSGVLLTYRQSGKGEIFVRGFVHPYDLRDFLVRPCVGNGLRLAKRSLISRAW